MTARHLRVVPVADLGVLATEDRLRELVERIFGRGNRPTGWFSRKLARECIVPELSVVATFGDPRDWKSWCGYVLGGNPPSLPTTVRTAGVGVLAGERRRGIGERMLATVAALGCACNRPRLRVTADERVVSFYDRLGFATSRRVANLLAFGPRGNLAPRSPPRPWAALDGNEITGWLPEAWEGTDPQIRRTIEVPGLSAHVSCEGRAMVVHRIVVRSGCSVVDAFERVRAMGAGEQPVVVAGVDPALPYWPELEARGWSLVQVGREMERFGLDR